MDRNYFTDTWFKDSILASRRNVNFEWLDPSTNEDQSGIVAMHLRTLQALVFWIEQQD